MNTRKSSHRSHSVDMKANTKKKFKIVKKPSAIEDDGSYRSFRLFDFQTYDSTNGPYKKFTVQMFGINEEGKTCALFVEDILPYFYVKIPDNWSYENIHSWYNSVKKQCKYNAKDCLEFNVEKHSQLYEFTANKQFAFVKCTFRNMSGF